MIDFETLPWEHSVASPSASSLKCEAVEPTHKKCSRCKSYKTLSSFHKFNKGTLGVQAYCKPRAISGTTNYSREKKTGLNPESYQKRLRAQDYGCAICGDTNPGNGRGSLMADHCHTTGSARGLLCSSDNLSLGQLNDDPIRFLKSAAFLVAHGAPMPDLSIFHTELARQRALIASY